MNYQGGINKNLIDHMNNNHMFKLLNPYPIVLNGVVSFDPQFGSSKFPFSVTEFGFLFESYKIGFNSL